MSHKYQSIFLICTLFMKLMASQGCYPCNTLNRKWSSKLCGGGIQDCGSCISGFIMSDYAEECKVSEVVVKSDHIAIVPRGSSLVLECRHSRQIIINCKWARRDAEVRINGRYKFLLDDPIGDGDCSIQIENFQDDDVGEWKCHIYNEHSPNDPSHVKYSWIYFHEPDVVYVVENDNTFLPFGETVVLMCIFTRGVHCAWSKDGLEVEIGSRYSYITHTSNGQLTKDCSLKIDDFQEVDVGTWQCERKASADHKGSKKQPIELIPVVPALRIVEMPKTQNVTVGKEVTINCIFNHNVNCTWKRSGNMMAPGSHYKYEQAVQTTNCKLLITSLIQEDLGEWTCGHHPGHKFTTKEVSASVTLLVPPQVSLMRIVTGTPQEFVTGTSATSYLCLAMQSFPVATLIWYINGQKQETKYKVEEDKKLANTSSEFQVVNHDNRVVACVVQHPAFEREFIVPVTEDLPIRYDIPPIRKGSEQVFRTFTIASLVILLLTIPVVVISWRKYFNERHKNRIIENKLV